VAEVRPTLRRCETCGKVTVIGVFCCGLCARDWNLPGGLFRIAERRRRHGLPPMERTR
jgi:hypothetical protein